MVIRIEDRQHRHFYFHEVKPNDLGFVGDSSEMIKVYTAIRQIGNTKATVNIRGETGTGKELAARALHKLSKRDPYIAVNCAVFPRELLEALLFGIEKGIASNVIERNGIIAQTNSGTLFLDEIADMPIEMQIKLLRTIETGEYQRVGGNPAQQKSSDFRLITASSKDLEKCIEEGEFRRDFYYRINVIPIELPSLKSRGTDSLLLAKYFCGLDRKSVV